MHSHEEMACTDTVSGKPLLRDEYVRLIVTREFAERAKGECSLGCKGEFDDGRCGLAYDIPCCIYRKALRDDAATRPLKDQPQ